MQVKLLRVIQEKSVRPVGSAEEQPVDVRILSATHKDLREEVSSGRFREDLFYRVNVIELRVAPLRERTGDVDILVADMLGRIAAEHGTEPARLTDEARAKLAGYRFPGNVRELENILERAVALSTDGQICADDIQLQEQPELGDTGSRERLGEQLESVEREAIERALKETRYNKTAAAKLLGLTLRALRYRMQKLGID